MDTSRRSATVSLVLAGLMLASCTGEDQPTTRTPATRRWGPAAHNQWRLSVRPARHQGARDRRSKPDRTRSRVT